MNTLATIACALSDCGKHERIFILHDDDLCHEIPAGDAYGTVQVTYRL
jgi:hypothetical protein